uniref:Uncharacterized protein n=1 Tax=Anguilla anguilla TaxID=7936 RepID=A0A0E9XL12_ANGAN
MFFFTSLIASSFSNCLPFFSLFMINRACRFCLISSTFFIASTVLFHNSLWYFSGIFLRFSNSRELSTVNSLPAAFLKALVHLVFLGLRFFLKFL